MKHIDNTPCPGNRKSRPLKSQIAYYWKDKCYEHFNYFMDWGEPSCWACGKFISDYDQDTDEQHSTREIFNVWDNHKYLERCHIVPVAHGGCNCEANLVLLCRECHRKSPDTLDPLLFIQWIKNRLEYVQKEFMLELENMGYIPGDEDIRFLCKNHERFVEYVRSSAIPVGGHISKSSYICCLIEFLKTKK